MRRRRRQQPLAAAASAQQQTLLEVARRPSRSQDAMLEDFYIRSQDFNLFYPPVEFQSKIEKSNKP